MQGLTQLAAALSGQGRQDEAQPYLRRGIDGRRRLAGERSLDTLEAEQNIVWWLMDKSEDEPEAEPLARHLVELDREIRGMDARETLEAQATLAFMLIEAGKLDEGDALARETLAAVQRTFGEQDHLCGFLEIVLGNSALDRGDPVAAEGLFRDALEFARRFGEGELFGGAIAALRLSLALGGQGRWAEAEALAREAGSTFLRIGGTSIFTVGAFTYLGIALVAQGKNAEAEDAYRQLVDLCAHSPDPDRPEAINASRLLAQHLVRMGKSAEAEPFARAVVEACRRVSTAQPEDAQAAARLVRSLGTWASVLADLGRGAEADQSFREARKICDESLLGDDEGTLDTLESLAILLDGQGRSVEAEPLSRRILDGRRRTLGEQHPNTLLAQNNLAWILYRLGRSAEAEPLARAAVEGGRHVSLSPPNRVAQLDTLASILTDLGRLDEAEALFTEIEGLQSDGPDRLRPDPEIMIRHAECLLALERPDEAEQRLLDAHALLISQGLGHSPAARTAAQRLSELYAGRGRTGEAQVWLDKLAGNSAGS
jgi:tetratricopeptide (TPR) repeat protein